MNYNIIGSSSKGNCLIIDDKIMIDCGVSYSKIKPFIKNVAIICLTHEHSDHFKASTIKQIASNYPTKMWVCGNHLVDKLVKCNVPKTKIFPLEEKKTYCFGKAFISIEQLVHDVPNVCYKIDYNGKKIFYATDTGRIDHITASCYDYYFIEANYESDEALDEEIKKAKENDEYTHLERVKYTHLSQVQCMNWLYKNMGENSQYIWMHQHVEKEGEIND